jgi:hypothetical protein
MASRLEIAASAYLDTRRKIETQEEIIARHQGEEPDRPSNNILTSVYLEKYDKWVDKEADLEKEIKELNARLKDLESEIVFHLTIHEPWVLHLEFGTESYSFEIEEIPKGNYGGFNTPTHKLNVERI